MPGKPLAEFVCPGHPLLDATVDVVLQRHRTLLRDGAMLVADADPRTEPRALVYLEHAIQDGRTTRDGQRHVVSKRFSSSRPTGPGRSGSRATPPTSTTGRSRRTSWS